MTNRKTQCGTRYVDRRALPPLERIARGAVEANNAAATA